MREESADGFELRFAVNYLAPFLLTHLLFSVLSRSVAPRIVNVASGGQAPIDFSDVMLTHGYDGMRAYCRSKLALIAFTFEMAERLVRRGDHHFTLNALHPASQMNTKMTFEYFEHALSTIEEGLEATVRLVADPQLEGVSGRYFDGLAEGRARPQAYDTDARQQLWRLSEELTGLGAVDRIRRDGER
jgi:NAD(P)-dependent dehydrogenase (short-subunit alcohol dehydrogenase family)